VYFLRAFSTYFQSAFTPRVVFAPTKTHAHPQEPIVDAEPVPEEPSEAAYDWLERNVARPVLQAVYSLPGVLGPAVRELSPAHWRMLLAACTQLYQSALGEAKVFYLVVCKTFEIGWAKVWSYLTSIFLTSRSANASGLQAWCFGAIGMERL
jgi:hypothetical protein